MLHLKWYLTLPLEYKDIVVEALKDYNFENDYKIECSEKDGKLELLSLGKAAHAAHPDLGYNSLSALLGFINALDIKVAGLSTAKYFGEEVKLEFNMENLVDFTTKMKNLEKSL